MCRPTKRAESNESSIAAGQTSVDADGQPLHDGVDAFIEARGVYGAKLAEAGCRPASTLLGVARLAIPSLMVEIEATAVK
jgi:hypothetical protein